MAITDIGAITLNCGVCGSDEVSIEGDGDPSDKLTCAKCGAYLGTRAGFIEAATATAKSAVPDIAKALRKALKL